jgi:predicted tellurium resistance membrane protein TerC
MEHVITLLFLVLLQAVLGFDNLLYISIESRRAPPDKQSAVRRWGLGIAVVLRIALLFVVIQIIELVTSTLFAIDLDGVLEAQFNLESLIILGGGVFIMYTAVKEIWHMVSFEEHEPGHEEKRKKTTKSPAAVIIAIVLMNLVFSFDSILSAMALTRVFWVMATAIVIGGVLMIWLADRIAAFLQKNRLYEVLGLFILLIVGVMLLTEGGHTAHIRLFDAEITKMSKATFYFVITVLVVVDVIQQRYQKKLALEEKAAG